MFKKSLVLFLSLISCSSSIDNSNKNDTRDREKSFRDKIQPLVLDSKKYKNIEIVTLRGNIDNIEKEIVNNKMKPKEEIEDFKEEYNGLFEIAQNYIRSFRGNAYIPQEFILNCLKAYLGKVLQDKEKQNRVDKVENDELFMLSFAMDTYIESRKQNLNINFKDYISAFLEEIKSYLDKYPKKYVYFSVYNTSENLEYEEDFLEVVEHVFNR